jgi:DNA invertase Pin-like site-specific DNA recombinase
VRSLSICAFQPTMGTRRPKTSAANWRRLPSARAGRLSFSGSKGRDQRPGLDALMKGATKREFDMVAAWSVDRLGRSLPHLVQLFSEFQALGVDIYLHQQAVDSSTPAGRALLQMSGVFAEFGKAMLQERVATGLARAKAEGKTLGRPRAKGATDAAILRLRDKGMGMIAIGKKLGCGTGRVQEVLKGAA